MKKIDKETLKEASQKLLFEMSEQEYDTLLIEFDVIISQMEIISQIEGIDDVEPMVFPYECFSTCLREDVVNETLSKEEVLKNAKEVKDGMITLPKVIG